MACQTLKPSELRDKVVLYGKAPGAPDGLGGFAPAQFTVTWTGRAKATFGGLRDRVTGEYLGVSGAATLWIRRSAPIETAARADVDGVQYSVTGVDPLTPGSHYRKAYLRLWEHEVV